MRKVLIIFLLVVFAGVGIVGFWYWQKNIYSKDTLELEILGPESVQAGQEIEYLVKMKNNGKVRLENPELIFQAPEQSVLKDYPNLRVTQKIEDIYPGEQRTYSFKAQLFGEKDSTLEAKAWLSYQPKNLKAIFESKTTLTTRIEFIPLTFEFDLPLKVEKGEEIKFSLNYFSNIDYLLENLRVKIEYPSDFIFESSLPQALDENEWSLPSLFQASGGRIEINGLIEGKEGQKKVFRAQLGMLKDGDFWLLKETAQSIEIIESSLYISNLINNSPNYIANAGDFLHYEIYFKNIGKRPVQKKYILVRLEGEFFDLTTLKSDKGEFGQGDNTILWDWKNVSDLRFLDVGQEGKIEFWIRVKENIDYQIKNAKLKAEIALGEIEKVFETKINSQLTLFQKAYFTQEFFENLGSLPPKIGQAIDYVIVWQVENTCNELKNVKVKSALSENVQPTGKIFPEDAKFTYDSQSKTVMWNIGEVGAWQSFENIPLILAFQVRLTPDFSQKGKTPLLIKESNILAEDNWTSEILEEKASAVNTTLPDDETVSPGQGIVGEQEIVE